MKFQIQILCLVAIFSITLCCTPPTLRFPEGEKYTVEVIGVENGLAEKNWKDHRIGLGIQSLLYEKLYQTGYFKMMETNPDILKKRREIAEKIWAGLYKDNNYDEVIDASDARFQAWAKVIYFGTPQTGVSLGVLHQNKSSAVLRIEVVLFEKSSGKKWKAVGEGKSSTTASSVLFTFQKDKAAFDQSNIANALDAALENAINRIFGKD